MTAREHHPQLVVLERSWLKHVVDGRPQRPFALDEPRELWGELPRRPFAAKHVDRAVLGRRGQQRRVVLGHAAVAPRLEGAGQRLLHDVLGEREVLDAEDAGQDGDESCRLAP